MTACLRTPTLDRSRTRMQYGKLLDLFRDVKENGYQVALGGTIDESLAGNFVPVTIIDNPPEDSRIVQEEPFGPILPILSFQDVDEAVAKANDSPSRLGRLGFLGDGIATPPSRSRNVLRLARSGSTRSISMASTFHSAGTNSPAWGSRMARKVWPSSPTPRPICSTNRASNREDHRAAAVAAAHPSLDLS